MVNNTVKHQHDHPASNIPGERIRCFCARHPTLAIVKTQPDGRPLVHIKIFKQQTVYGEIEMFQGTMRVRCRECFRWHTISIIKDKTQVIPDEQSGNTVATDDTPPVSYVAPLS